MCDLQLNTCGQKVVPVSLRYCRKTASCNEICPDEKNFVCGSDNKFYRNECEMRKENCGYVKFSKIIARILIFFLF